jgi:hypothetical protein
METGMVLSGWLKRKSRLAPRFPGEYRKISSQKYQADLTKVRMHLAHNSLRTLRLPSKTLTFCKFGLNWRGVAFLDQGRFCPKEVVFPQFAHFAMMNHPFLNHHRVSQSGQTRPGEIDHYRLFSRTSLSYNATKIKRSC